MHLADSTTKVSPVGPSPFAGGVCIVHFSIFESGKEASSHTQLLLWVCVLCVLFVLISSLPLVLFLLKVAPGSDQKERKGHTENPSKSIFVSEKDALSFSFVYVCMCTGEQG